MKKFWHVLLGKGEHDDQILQDSSDEAHKIKNAIQKDMMSIMTQINEVSRDNSEKLRAINKKIGVVSRQIAIATGGKRRGL